MINPAETLDETIAQLGYLVTLLGDTYNFQYDKDVDLTSLGQATDALIFATSQLVEQKKLQVAADKKRLAHLTSSDKE